MLPSINRHALTRPNLINAASAILNRASSINFQCHASHLSTFNNFPSWREHDAQEPSNSPPPNHNSASCCSSSQSSKHPVVILPSSLNFSWSSSLSGLISSPASSTKIFKRGISIYRPLFSNEKEGSSETAEEDGVSSEGEDGKPEPEEKSSSGREKKAGPLARHLDRDRSKKIPVETSMRYLKSAAYREAYGDNPVWVLYRRNFPGQFQPKNTRKTCIRNDEITTGNPCPICRDVYLVVDYRNVELLKQFISPYTGDIVGWDKTGVCRRQHERLLVEIDRAKDYGTITFDVPFREYDYAEYEKLYQSY